MGHHRWKSEIRNNIECPKYQFPPQDALRQKQNRPPGSNRRFVFRDSDLEFNVIIITFYTTRYYQLRMNQSSAVVVIIITEQPRGCLFTSALLLFTSLEAAGGNKFPFPCTK